MCGIAGSINILLTEETLNLINHRGPDSKGLINFELNSNKVFLGHTRLSIVDLSEAGSQPMISQCRNYCIVFNGEIYNHQDLRKKIPEIKFRGHSDTETILYYIAKYGIEGVKDFNGIFAFAFLDKKSNKLFLVRDPFGVKPVYYRFKDNSIIFSSEIRPIISKTKEELDVQNLASLLLLRFNPSPETLYKDIKKLNPAHWLEIDIKDKLELKKCSFTIPIPGTKRISYKDALEQYSNYINKAVERQLLSDVEIGILLSGGVDSAIIANLSQKYSSNKLKAFTVGFEGSHDADEISDAKETARILGMDHYYTKIGFDDFLNTFKECSRIVEEPIATTSLIPMYFLAKLASEQVKVVLTGQGADEPLGGYKRYQGELIRQFLPNKMIDISSKIVNILGLKNETLIRSSSALGEKDETQRFLNTYSIFSNEEIEALIGIKETQSYGLLKDLYFKLGCERKKHPVEKMMSIDARMNLSDDLLLYTDKITMNFSLECRVPMLDIELVNFIESLPASYRLKIRETKIIHKDFAKSILPLNIINRPKKGFMSPTKTWFVDNVDKIQEILTSKETRFSNVFDKTEVKKLISQHKKGYNKEKQIFLLLSLYYWMERN